MVHLLRQERRGQKSQHTVAALQRKILETESTLGRYCFLYFTYIQIRLYVLFIFTVKCQHSLPEHTCKCLRCTGTFAISGHSLLGTRNLYPLKFLSVLNLLMVLSWGCCCSCFTLPLDKPLFFLGCQNPITPEH